MYVNFASYFLTLPSISVRLRTFLIPFTSMHSFNASWMPSKSLQKVSEQKRAYGVIVYFWRVPKTSRNSDGRSSWFMLRSWHHFPTRTTRRPTCSSLCITASHSSFSCLTSYILAREVQRRPEVRKESYVAHRERLKNDFCDRPNVRNRRD